MIPMHNWSNNIPFNATQTHTPTTITQLQEIVGHADKVGIIGARHSFSPIADTTGDMISLSQLEEHVEIDPTHHTATVSAGITYETLGPLLHAAGYALPNMASLPHITVVGACSTATHGSGQGLGNLATPVSGLEFVAANGELISLNREQDGDAFDGAVVGLGALGVVTNITLDLVPTFMMQQEIYRGLPLSMLYENFDAVMASGYSVSLFTNWQQGVIDNAWIKHKLTDDIPMAVPDSLFDARFASHEHTLDRPDRTLTPVSTPGPWYERLIHMWLKHPPGPGDELQTEYFVPRRHAVDALREVENLRSHLEPIIDLSELRTIAADQLWMSTAYGQDVVAIHFNWRHDWPGVSRFLPIIEEALAPFEARPHWGKLFAMSPARVQSHYERLADFQALAQNYDPQGKFRNTFLDAYIFGG